MRNYSLLITEFKAYLLFEQEIINGIIGGLIATFGMFIIEFTAFLRWGNEGVQEKQLGSIIIAKLLKRPSNSITHEGLPIHFIAGGLIGGLFSAAILLLPPNPPVIYLAFMMALFIQLFGVIIFQTVTKYPPISETLGYIPILVNTFAHIIYGIILGLWIVLY